VGDGASGGAERERDWLRLCEVLDGSLRGRGSVALLTGPAGIGKSDLLRAARIRADAARMQTLSASARPDERAFAFGVVLQLLEPALDAGDRERLLGSGANGDEPGFDVLHRLYLACAKLAAQAPLALLVDDADAADSQSIAFLVHLARRLDDLPIAVVASAGSHGGADLPELLELVSGCARGVRCELRPLDAGATAKRVVSRWPGATAEECADIHEGSGGYPFLIDTLAAARAQPNGDPAPAIAGWALRRARQAHDGAAALLTAAAVLGTGCRLRHAGELAGLSAEDAGLVADRLAAAVLLQPGEPLRFEQPVVADAIEASLGPGERSAAHLRAARLLDADGDSPEEPAAHLLAAIPSGDEWAVDVLQRAATLAVGHGAPGTAVRYLRRALDEPPPAARRAQVVFALGHAEALSGEPQAAERLSASAVDYANDARQEPRTALTAGRALLALGEADKAIGVLESALGETGLEPSMAERIRGEHMVAHWLARLPEGGGPVVGEPPAGADTSGDRARLALHAIDRALRGTHCRDVRELALTALGSGALLEDETADGLTFYLATAALAAAEDLTGAEAALTAAIDDAHGRGSVLGLATASAVRALTVLLAGRVADAAADARNGIAAERHGWRIALGDARVVLAHCLIESGDLAGANRQLNLGEAVVPDGHLSRIPLLAARGRLQLASGDPTGARGAFLLSGELAEKAGVRNPALAPWRSGAGGAIAALGDSTEGRRLISEELELAESFGAPGPIGRALRALASTQAPRQALELLEAAVETLDGSQADLERARALVDFGGALRRASHRADARTPLYAGLETAQRCGAEPLARRAMRELTSAGARPRRAAQAGPGALTAREREVAALAAQGLSNREIAKTLVVTVKTVEWHLKHSYRKLGVESRHQLPGFFPATRRRRAGDRP
jgi:DNA-binding CsgD family transcriptional regulator